MSVHTMPPSASSKQPNRLHKKFRQRSNPAYSSLNFDGVIIPPPAYQPNSNAAAAVPSPWHSSAEDEDNASLPSYHTRADNIAAPAAPLFDYPPGWSIDIKQPPSDEAQVEAGQQSLAPHRRDQMSRGRKCFTICTQWPNSGILVFVIAGSFFWIWLVAVKGKGSGDDTGIDLLESANAGN